MTAFRRILWQWLARWRLHYLAPMDDRVPAQFVRVQRIKTKRAA